MEPIDSKDPKTGLRIEDEQILMKNGQKYNFAKNVEKMCVLLKFKLLRKNKHMVRKLSENAVHSRYKIWDSIWQD